jgi:cytochrome c oxidase assembly protein subunit 15
MQMKRNLILMIALIYLVILAGGLVRMTGSGMGCPDWPKCFGQYIPPTDISELPADYKTRFAVMGKEIADFSAFHTWVEYINRLLGVLLGLSIFVFVIQTLLRFKKDKILFSLAVLQLIMVGFQGWLGAVVVATDLAPAKVTVHMLMAILLIINGFAMLNRIQTNAKSESVVSKSLIVLAFVLVVIQIVLGTQVREGVDVVAKEMNNQGREYWIEQLPLVFKIHRSASIVVLLMILWLSRKSLRLENNDGIHSRLTLGITAIILFTGIVMAYFAIPAFAQPIHLLLSLALSGVLASWFFSSSTLRSK